MADYRLKEALIALKILPEEQLNFTYEDIFSELESLEKNAGTADVLSALDKVAGCYDVMRDLSMTSYVYRIPNVGTITVYAGSPELAYVYYGEVSGEEVKSIFLTGMGFNPNGWTSEEVMEFSK